MLFGGNLEGFAPALPPHAALLSPSYELEVLLFALCAPAWVPRAGSVALGLAAHAQLVAEGQQVPSRQHPQALASPEPRGTRSCSVPRPVPLAGADDVQGCPGRPAPSLSPERKRWQAAHGSVPTSTRPWGSKAKLHVGAGRNRPPTHHPHPGPNGTEGGQNRLTGDNSSLPHPAVLWGGPRWQ